MTQWRVEVFACCMPLCYDAILRLVAAQFRATCLHGDFNGKIAGKNGVIPCRGPNIAAAAAL